MSETRPIDFYELLPALYRLRDAEVAGASSVEASSREPLKAFLEVLSEQANIVRESVDAFWDDLFIETCADWVIPYIGDLVGNRPLSGVTVARRVDVAKTIYYRRRKGTLPMLEELARDVTGWGAHAVEFFELLVWLQNLNHLRLDAARNPDRLLHLAFDRVGTANVRDVDVANRVGGPFDVTSHTADVRAPSQNHGWHNIKRIGFFLWRLQSYPLANVRARARPDAGPPFGFHFSSIGSPTQLFTNPRKEPDPTGLAREFHLPGALHRTPFRVDLDGYTREQGAIDPGERALQSVYYGASQMTHETSLSIRRDGEQVPPLEVESADLESWSRPPATVSGLRSGALAVIPALASLSFELQIGDRGPVTVTLASAPGTAAAAATTLEDAIRQADASREFRAARVVALDGDRLYVIPGVVGAALTFTATGAVPEPVGALRLASVDAETLRALLSRDLAAFRRFAPGAPRVRVALAGGSSHLVELVPNAQPTPGNLAELRDRLETQIQGADPSLGGVRVYEVEGRLLIVPGEPAERLTVEADATDPLTAHALGLVNRVAVDVERGRMTFAVGDEPTEVRVDYHYGFAADLGGGPYDRSASMAPDEGVPKILVPSQESTVAAALSAWQGTTEPRTIIEIEDNDTYPPGPAPGNLTIDVNGRARPVEVLLSASLETFPTFPSGTDAVEVTIDGVGARTATLASAPTTIDEARSLLEDAIRAAVPAGPADADSVYSNTRVVVAGDRLAIVAGTGGALTFAEVGAGTTASRLGLLPADSRSVRSLLGGPLSPFPEQRAALTESTPAVLLTLGDDGPHLVELSAAPGDVDEARSRLESAIRSAETSSAFTSVDVAVLDEALLVIPGLDTAPPLFSLAPNDETTLVDLALESERFELVIRSRSGWRPTLAGNVTIVGGAGQTRVGLEGVLVAGAISVEGELGALDLLHTTLVPGIFLDEDGAPVSPTDPSLVAIEGTNDRLDVSIVRSIVGPVRLPDSVNSLRIEDSIVDASGADPALAGLPGPGDFGPPAAIDRSTILGSTRVRSLNASETLFSGAVVVERAQSGCVRFSYVPDDVSTTPRRYRCQPDLALENLTTTQAQEITRRRVAPTFTSRHYGSPAYCQLSLNGSEEISRGARDGSEMGAMGHLKQPQRESDLRLRLDEYLPFGLEPVMIYTT